MPYCPKCGNKIDETMFFCPTCGIALKGAAANSAATNYESEKQEKTQKGEYGFVGYLISGLILITLGSFAILDLTSNGTGAGQDLVFMLVITGLIITGGAVYVATPARKFIQQLIIRPKKSSKT
jgi:hypothetical protein